VPRADLAAGAPLLDVLVATGLVKSKGEGRRLIAQGGAYVNGVVVEDAEARLTLDDCQHGAILLRAGKKRYARIVVDA
jgi:tyrosyl-tRNA synthetase